MRVSDLVYNFIQLHCYDNSNCEFGIFPVEKTMKSANLGGQRSPSQILKTMVVLCVLHTPWFVRNIFWIPRQARVIIAELISK
jgi:hypothetical protein